nr:hypothetical protein [Tanacetum cinerariifolium]
LEGIFCHQCTCKLCENGAHYGYNCPLKVPVIHDLEPFNNHTIKELPPTVQSFDPKSNLVHNSPNIFSPSLQPPIYSYEFCGNDAYYGQDFSLQVSFTYDPKPCYNQNFNFPQNFQTFQQYPCCTRCGGPHETCQCNQLIFDEPHYKNYEGPHMNFHCQLMNQNFYNYNSFGFDQFQPSQFPVIHQPPQEMNIQELEDLKQQYFDGMKHLINLKYHDEIKIDELKGNFNSMSIEINKKEKLQQLKHVSNLSTYPSKHFNSFCYDDDDDEDYNIAVTPSLSTEEPDNSLSIGDEHLDTIPATKSNEFIKSSVEILIPIPSESEEGIDDDILLTIKDDILREKLLNINLLTAKIEALNDNPTPSSDFMTKYSSTSLNSLLEETNTFDNSLPEFKLFCFDVEKISSGKISSGSTTTHSDSSLNNSFIFYLSMNPFPPADRSDFYKFADELIHIISPPEYDCFFFKIEPNSGNFTMDVMEDISLTRELRVHNALPTHPTLQLNLEFKLSRNEDTIFDPDICSYPISSF